MARKTALVLAFAGILTAALLGGRLALLFAVIIVAIVATGEMFRLLRAQGVLPSAPLGYAGNLALLIVAYVRGERAPAVFAVVVAAIVIANAPDPPTTDATPGPLFREAWQGVMYTWRNPALRGLGFSISAVSAERSCSHFAAA